MVLACTIISQQRQPVSAYSPYVAEAIADSWNIDRSRFSVVIRTADRATCSDWAAKPGCLFAGGPARGPLQLEAVVAAELLI
jgi:hypothetical protein